MKKLKKEYRKIKDKQQGTGQGREEWPFFEVMDAVLGHKPATSPGVIIDSLADCENSPVDHDDEFEDKSLFTQQSEDTTSTQTVGSDSAESSKVKPSSTPIPKVERHKKKKHSKTEKFEVLMDGMVKQLVEAQGKSEERFMELEEKRMRMEERLLEKEIEMQRESRNFQLQMMQMMTSVVYTQQGAASFPPPISTSQYPPYYPWVPYDNDETQIYTYIRSYWYQHLIFVLHTSIVSL